MVGNRILRLLPAIVLMVAEGQANKLDEVLEMCNCVHEAMIMTTMNGDI